MDSQKKFDDDGLEVDIMSGTRTIPEESYRLPVIIDYEDKEPQGSSA